jgi:putative protease
MRIILPVDNLQEPCLLLEAGADELYGGYVPAAWVSYNLAASLKQRTFSVAQITPEQEHSESIALVHALKCTFVLTLNASFCT